MNSFDEMITTFARKLRNAPTHNTCEDFVEMTRAFVDKLALAPRCVYAVYDMHPDSMVLTPSLVSIHASLEGAIEAVPKNLLGYEREGKDDWVKEYAYVAIRKIDVLVP
jgi:hypothetical protein